MSCLSLVHGCLSLVHGCLSLVHGCLSLVHGCLSLVRGCLSLDLTENRFSKIRFFCENPIPGGKSILKNLLFCKKVLF